MISPSGEESSVASNVMFEDDNMVERISCDRTGSLARMAVAFSPPEQPVEIKDIEHVDVLSVDDHHIELQAVICETEGCVTLFVPVEFPHACDQDESNGMEECIIENMDELDQLAMQWLEQHDQDSEQAKAEAEEEPLVVESNEVLPYPSWWSKPAMELVDECENIQKILNGDGFQDAVESLVSKELNDRKAVVQKAMVAASGTSGLLMRARVAKLDIFGDEMEKIIMDVPVRFHQKVTDSESLRSAVLGLMAAP
eukprot:CAMPEP_0118673300 /NCGR_PEP_ID=MMETSP0800-20121206/242_1 /TAXON_ID=210618 ORGANISM="Striatella unipunctata, Strain CCMP2910" /NCGR_SAMPLE_ID=MMETSP0800 /ASSEMBLY_ACC=CAM_ASM_000638 /LENGTH=254 /DNA_ID=CAMNT_0006568341 /DNA_START=303 /DNA_END=1067 /DNA_ORIENTATION=-